MEGEDIRWKQRFRNLSVHTYDEEKANSLDLLIRTKYFPLFHRLLKDIQTDSKN